VQHALASASSDQFCSLVVLLRVFFTLMLPNDRAIMSHSSTVNHLK